MSRWLEHANHTDCVFQRKPASRSDPKPTTGAGVSIGLRGVLELGPVHSTGDRSSAQKAIG